VAARAVIVSDESIGHDAATSTRLSIQLVVKSTSPRTGLGRYGEELEHGLRQAGARVRRAELGNWAPRPLSAFARQCGYDLPAFSRSYPLRADVRPGYLTFLTSQTLATLLTVQRLPRPVVVMVHDILPYLLRNDAEMRTYHHRLDRLMDAVAMRGLRRADHLITNSEYTKQTVVDVLGVASERIDAIHLGVDRARFRPRPVPDDFRARYDLRVGQRYILAVGTEDPRKNLAALLRAMPTIARDVGNIRLLKVGAPAFVEQRRRHLELCRELDIEAFVRWFDEVPEDDLPLFYNVADVFAFPSIYEGFGFPVLEALACGTPVVAARRASIPEIAGELGTLVDDPSPHELARAITAALRAEQPDVEALVAWATRFAWHQTIVRTLAVCEGVSREHTCAVRYGGG
jgi:glycosyltransferase involved in cell wall biosynthesis